MNADRDPEDGARTSPQRAPPVPAAEPQPADGAVSPPDRSRVRLRKWVIGLVVAVVGAALADVATGGLTSGLSKGWDAVLGKSDPPPLTVSAHLERGRRSAFVFEQRVSALPPRPPGMSPEARAAWAVRHGGIDAYTTAVQVVVQGRSDAAVILLGLDVEVVSRNRPPTGTLASAEGAGGIGVRYFQVNLDRRLPEVELGELDEPQPGQRRLDFPYKVSLTDPEVFVIFGNARRCDCRWLAKLRWQSGDEDGTTVIRDGDQPFRTASGAAARDRL